MGEVSRAGRSPLGREVAVVLPATARRGSPGDSSRKHARPVNQSSGTSWPSTTSATRMDPLHIVRAIDGEIASAADRQSPDPRAPRAIEHMRPRLPGWPCRCPRSSHIYTSSTDLKPENVFVTKTGQAKILDFLARQLAGVATGGPRLPKRRTRRRARTPSYMSPSRSAARRPIIAPTFSSRRGLYEMLSGEHPVSLPHDAGHDERDSARRAASSPPHSRCRAQARARRSSLPQKEPAARFQSARDPAFRARRGSFPSGAFASAARCP